MSTDLTFTFAGDESGDPSFSFGKGATRYFVLAVIATQKPDDLREALMDFRKTENIPQDFEFHFHSLSSAGLRRKVFERLKSLDFESWIMVADKTSLPDVYRIMSGQDLYLYFVSELIKKIPLAKRMNGTLILDEYGSGKVIRQGLRRVMKVREIQPGFRRIITRQSHREDLIQIADLVAGAVMHRDANKGNEAYDFLQGKIKALFDYPNL